MKDFPVAFEIARLNGRWRVIDSSTGWLVQLHGRMPMARGQGRVRVWRTVIKSKERADIIETARRFAGKVSPEAMAVLDALPKRKR